jgi:hypothetical protein
VSFKFIFSISYNRWGSDFGYGKSYTWHFMLGDFRLTFDKITKHCYYPTHEMLNVICVYIYSSASCIQQVALLVDLAECWSDENNSFKTINCNMEIFPSDLLLFNDILVTAGLSPMKFVRSWIKGYSVNWRGMFGKLSCQVWRYYEDIRTTGQGNTMRKLNMIT